jgi:hypothetical protein
MNGIGTPLTDAYSSTRAEYERTPRWRLIRRHRLRDEMRLYGRAVELSIRTPRR